jgi:hypothetical protein
MEEVRPRTLGVTRRARVNLVVASHAVFGTLDAEVEARVLEESVRAYLKALIRLEVQI